GATRAAHGVAAKSPKFEAGVRSMPNATPCQLPPESRLQESLLCMDYLDSFEVPSRTPEQDIVAIYAAALGHLPTVFKQLLVLRSHLVRPLGIAGVSYGDLARPIDTGRSYAVGDKIGAGSCSRSTRMNSSLARMTGTSIFACRSFEMPGHGLCSPRPW